MIQGGDPTGTGRFSKSIWGFEAVLRFLRIDILLKMRSLERYDLQGQVFLQWYEIEFAFEE